MLSTESNEMWQCLTKVIGIFFGNRLYSSCSYEILDHCKRFGTGKLVLDSEIQTRRCFTINLTFWNIWHSDIVFRTRSINGGEKCIGGFTMKLVAKSFANNFTFPIRSSYWTIITTCNKSSKKWQEKTLLNWVIGVSRIWGLSIHVNTFLTQVWKKGFVEKNHTVLAVGHPHQNQQSCNVKFDGESLFLQILTVSVRLCCFANIVSVAPLLVRWQRMC